MKVGETGFFKDGQYGKIREVYAGKKRDPQWGDFHSSTGARFIVEDREFKEYEKFIKGKEKK